MVYSNGSPLDEQTNATERPSIAFEMVNQPWPPVDW
jgi:hypothetical protein